MKNPRDIGLEIVSKRDRMYSRIAEPHAPSDIFGNHVFNQTVMQRMLPKEVYENVAAAIESKQKIKPEYYDIIADAMKEWAISLGATHFTHWFQPLNGASAEKHDAFIDWGIPNKVIDRFSGNQLLQGEPDASSFPSGGLRSTYEARGYTGWDPTSPPFLWKAGDGITLCVPSIFLSWTGAALDCKIPLLRSDNKLNAATLRLLRLTSIPAARIKSFVGLEQEYFVIDKALRDLRPDLVMMGRTVVGASAPKGQELQDHYFGSVKDRILNYMCDFEAAALQLGIPVKTRHNEVAPAQYEVAPYFENASLAVDHNILLMELMRQIASKHDLACLLHEKPFKGINGSGKHCNWSIGTDTGINLLDPSETPGNNLHFLVLITAILHAIHRHSALLRASIGSAANDHRLGGHEAPPAIISVYVGKEIEQVLKNIESSGSHEQASTKGQHDIGLTSIPTLTKDNTDRNRTSPFAFTGNKFEFRAVGSSSNPSFAITVLNTIVAESLNEMVDEVERLLEGQNSHEPSVLNFTVIQVVRNYLTLSKSILFDGDNYSNAWKEEARCRRLPVIEKSIDAFQAICSEPTIRAFEGVLNSEELKSRYEVAVDTYTQTNLIEAKILLDLASTQIIPAAIHYQYEMASSLVAYKNALSFERVPQQQEQLLKHLGIEIEKALLLVNDLTQLIEEVAAISAIFDKSSACANRLLSLAKALRACLDALEMVVDDRLWPIPKYRELLFLN